MAYIQERTLNRNLVFFTPRGAGLETSGAWPWSIKAAPTPTPHTHTGTALHQQHNRPEEGGWGGSHSPDRPDMSLGRSGDLALVTSFLLWVYSKSLAAKDILKEVVLGAGVFLRSNMAQGVAEIHADRKTAPLPHGKEGGVGGEPVSSSSGCTSWVHPRLKAILSFSS